MHPYCENGIANSFAAAVINLYHPRTSARTVVLLLSAYVPLLAFAEPPIRYMVQAFVDPPPELAERFRGLGYQVLDRAALEAPVRKESLAELRKSELDQVRYWKPERIGDVIFNHWD
jgi:hypothetical protein